MGAIVKIIDKLLSFFVARVGLDWSYKVALISAVLAIFLIIWAAAFTALAGFSTLIPSSPLPLFLLQFFPSSAAVSLSVAIIFGSLLARRAWDMWLHSFSVVANISK